MPKRKCESDSQKSSKSSKTEHDVEAAKDIHPKWQDFELLSEETCIEPNVAKSMIKLLEDGNTIPFIARYRKNMINNMTPEELRVIKEQYEEINLLKSKLKSVAKTLEKAGQLNKNMRNSLASVRTVEELEHVFAPFKPESKRSLAERAKSVGLEAPAHNILNNVCQEDLHYYIKPEKEGLKSIKEVQKGIIHIIASIIANDTEVLGYVRDLRTKHYFMIETKKIDEKDKKNQSTQKNKNIDVSKYKLYFDFKIRSIDIKPHQILAVNRAENQKVLSVKLNIPDIIFNKFNKFCIDKFKMESGSKDRCQILKEAVEDSYTRLVRPLLVRETRSTLKQMAEKAAMETFSQNLKQLLLANPIKGKYILGMDPGFSNGCKLALISETGSLQAKATIHPFSKNVSNKAVCILKDILTKHRCEVIALGNGTACRETESWLSELITSNIFSPLKVTYTIVSEDGASIYSCSPEAQKEFPDLDPNIISAISLARRVQEPLAELVKVEPQHLGVGMYQHDLRKKHLNEALHEVVSECVSFVGVDLNTASKCLLKEIAGLTEKRAERIIQYREENGKFTYRKELLKVKGIGEKVFQQCAGFLRVGPINIEEEYNFYATPNTTKLDRTIIHPESYAVAKKLLKNLKLKEEDIGSGSFIETVNKSELNETELSVKLKTDEHSLKLILEALGKPLNHDLRKELNITPLFKKCLTSIEDLKTGTVLSGRVSNVTHFGCFVDVGVKWNALIHVSKLKGFQLKIGDRVEVEVIDLDLERKRIGLKFLKMSQ
ncbi:S1 RNA-binding domain-containing protein 1 [Coccinella septempunctata]|uniref:S1 RNA-binding domain-containing protein 1 n=1 Tax=Coccinella septempunctata TaxID=41139 RepID=UPI001D078706|nr:S1 RNA-binding domain-containing protein 1 [Coccinella septempunctata]